MDKGIVDSLDEGFVVFLDEGLLTCFDKNNKGGFYVDIRHSVDYFFEDLSFHAPLNSFLR